MATLLRRSKQPKAVKNLGWLLRNSSEVESLGFNYSHDGKQVNDGELVARLRDGGVYLSRFASLPVCWNWLDRPVFRGLVFNFVKLDTGESKGFIIGDTQWRMLGKMDFRAFFGQLGVSNR